jgi:FkbM family methyltransferase
VSPSIFALFDATAADLVLHLAMLSWKRRLIDALARPFGLEVVRSGSAWQLIEPEQLRRFFAHFEVDCVFDVGANYGQYAQRLRHMGFKGLILSFEPIPHAVQRMRAFALSDPRWVVEQTALDVHPRTTRFNVMKDSQFSSLHLPDHTGTAAFLEQNSIQERISVETRTLANLFPSLQAQFAFRRPFLKMDTQGHDVAVVQGAGGCIERFVGLQSELALTPLYEHAHDYQEALEYYRSLGFRLSALIPNNAGAFPDLNEVDCLMYNTRLI